MRHDPSNPNWLLAGANGRVGRLISEAWRAAPPRANVYAQSRNGTADLIWSPGRDGARNLQDFADRIGGLDAMICFIGPGSHGDAVALERAASAIVEAVRAAKSCGIRRVVLASSSAVYGLGQDLSETHVPEPTSDYGRSKVAIEKAVGPLRDKDFDICILRIGNVASADALLEQAPQTTPDAPLVIDKFPDGAGPIRSYVSPSALANIITTLLSRADPMPEILNVAGTPPIDMAELATAAKLPWKWRPASPDRHDTQRITLDCTRLAEIVGHAAVATSPEEIISDLKGLGVLP